MKRQYVRLLEIEPDLGSDLPRAVRAEARRLVVAPVARLGAGEYDADDLHGMLGEQPFGAMVVGGLLAHDLVLAGRVATYLLGRGDIVAAAAPSSDACPARALLTVTDGAWLALLDQTFTPVARRWPSVAGRLLVHAEWQAERVAVQQVISQLPRADQRIVALLWHLADRWGRQEAAGTVIPLTLGHEALGRLVGGRRATISGALSRLSQRGFVVRRANGTWLVTPASRALFDAPAAHERPPAIALLGTEQRRANGRHPPP